MPSGNVNGHINEVTLRRARLVLRWVTVHEITILDVTSHSDSDQLQFLPSAGCQISTNKQQQVLCGREGNRMSAIALDMHHKTLLRYIHLQARWPKEGTGTPCLHSSKKYGKIYFYLSMHHNDANVCKQAISSRVSTPLTLIGSCKINLNCC